MTPPTPAATAAGRLRGGAAPRVPRRVSGPAARPRPGTPRVRARAGRRAGATRAASAAAFLRGLPDTRLLDRLLRGRAWIALIAVALIGIVFMQVSLLKLNAGIGRAVTTVDTLERQNAELRAGVAALAGEGRIQDVAAEAGLVLPRAGDVEYRDARRASARRAVRAIGPPDHDRAAEVTAPAQPSTIAAAPAGPTEPVAPVAAVPPEPSAPATATGAAPAAAAPATTTTAPATTPAATPTATAPVAPAAAEGTATSVAGAVAAPAGGG